MNVELLKKLGNMDQLAGARSLCFTDGEAKGLNLIEVYNAAGLRFTVTADRCLDLYDCSYKGVNLSFHTKNGLNTLRNPETEEFFEQWPGGMLSTCGLTNVGISCFDNGTHPVHGRIGATSARHVGIQEGWEDDEYRITVSGETRQTRLYGPDLALRRSISTTLNSKALILTDTITNYNDADEEFMLLYHINFGYPLLDCDSECFSSHKHITLHGENCGSYKNMCKPNEEPLHQNYIHTTDALRACAAVINPALQLGCYIEYDTQNLPYMHQWKHMAAHDYVLALEPSNCLGLGRIEERKNGTIKVLHAYESNIYSITIGILDGEDEIQAFRKFYEK
jgi:hypothetical protein